jgi:ATP-dependent RNA helicase RhlE
MNTFSDFGLLPSILETLKEKKIFKPTEIQKNAIPLLMSNQSVVGVSETGSGKTLTYALPVLHILKSLEDNKNPVTEDSAPRAIVMVPSRDLGEQVSRVFKTFTHNTRLRVRPALGGMEFEQARRNVSGPFEVLLATPGRLVQLLDKQLISLHDVRVVVFDEADQMLDEGFLPDSRRIVRACPEDVQLSLFSATVSAQVEVLMHSLFSKAEVIKSANSGKTVKTLVTQNRMVIDGKRWPVFESVLKQRVDGGTLVFTNTREQCDKLANELVEKGYACAVYRGEMDKNERRSNLKKFRNGEIDLLISTDLAARGLDVEHVGRVINFHLPQQMDNYLHRAGRTARAGRTGLVVNLVTERDERLISKLEGRKIEVPRPLKSRTDSGAQSNRDSKGGRGSDRSKQSKSFSKDHAKSFDNDKTFKKEQSKDFSKPKSNEKKYEKNGEKSFSKNSVKDFSKAQEKSFAKAKATSKKTFKGKNKR